MTLFIGAKDDLFWHNISGNTSALNDYVGTTINQL